MPFWIIIIDLLEEIANENIYTRGRRTMKKILFFLIAFFIATSVSADWLKFEYGLSLSWLPKAAVVSYELAPAGILESEEEFFKRNEMSLDYWSGELFRSKLDLDIVLWNHLRIGGGVGTMFVYNPAYSWWTFNPVFSDYSFRASVSFYQDRIEVGYEHLCAHPTISTPIGAIISSLENEMSHDRFYIRFGNKR